MLLFGYFQDVGEEPYKANVMKITGNFFIVSCIETIAEGMTLAEKNGITRQAFASAYPVPRSCLCGHSRLIDTCCAPVAHD